MIRSVLVAGAIALIAGTSAQAADLIIPTTVQPIYESAGFSWDGLYVGIRAGGESYAGTTYGHIGGIVGANFIPVEPFLLGVELSGDYTWTNATSGAEFFANLKAGAVVTDSVLVYAIGGLGTYTSGGVNTGMYQLGGGIEVAVTDSVTVRGEVVGTGDFDGAADPFFEGAKATVGVFYHF